MARAVVATQDLTPKRVLSVSADVLIFDTAERGPEEDFRLTFEALSQFDPEEKAIAKKILQGLIIQHQAKRWSAVS